jgi:hypothetical protein
MKIADKMGETDLYLLFRTHSLALFGQKLGELGFIRCQKASLSTERMLIECGELRLVDRQGSVVQTTVARATTAPEYQQQVF